MARSRLRVVIALVAGTSASGAVADQKRPPYLPGGQSSLTARPATSYQLRREKDGWVHDAGGFIGRIADDGTVRFDDKRGTIGLALPLPLPLPAGTETLEGALRKLNPRNRQRQPEPPPPAQPGPTEVLDPDVLEATYGARVRIVRDGDRILVTDQRTPAA